MDFSDYLGRDIPKLGFGLMRLPKVGSDPFGPIDIRQLTEMVDLFMEAGFSYFDTAFVYDGSEAAIKTALVDRYPRESYQLATKLPGFGLQSHESATAKFYESLERTGAGFFDYYLLHNVAGERIKAFEDYGVWEFLVKCREEGLLKHLGFSFHDTAEVLDTVLTRHPEAEFVQLQVNYADWDSPSVQSRACFETAHRHNKPVVVMEPVKGGKLSALPPEVEAEFTSYDPEATVASWGLRYAGSLDGIITVLSGMSSVEQMRDNLATFRDLRPLSADERQVIARALAVLEKIPTIPCTSCGYCLEDCPEHINIPSILKAVNELSLYRDTQGAARSYFFATSRGNAGKASSCQKCGNCESICPQKIDIIEELEHAVELFE